MRLLSDYLEKTAAEKKKGLSNIRKIQIAAGLAGGVLWGLGGLRVYKALERRAAVKGLKEIIKSEKKFNEEIKRFYETLGK